MEWVNANDEFPTGRDNIFVKYKWTLGDKDYTREIANFGKKLIYFHNDNTNPWELDRFEELLWLKES